MRHFVGHLTESNFITLNKPTPTRYNKSNDTHSCIDLSLATESLKIDYWDVNQAKYDPNFSDHFEIYFSVQVAIRNEDIYHSSWNLTSRNRWAQFQRRIFKQIQSSSQTQIHDVHSHARSLNDVLYYSAINTIGFRRYHRGFKPWWNDKLNDLKIQCKRIRRHLQLI